MATAHAHARGEDLCVSDVSSGAASPAVAHAPGYRKDVDGLRAVAIVPVVLFHCGMGALSGGFVGVDVFFVISGFLITSVIAREIAAGRFSMARFYVRRAKRILPALAAVTMITLAVGFVLLGPSELEDLGRSAFWTALSGSNISFWRETNYFAGPADVKPLLMTWSLGVEEQFYLLWPIALVVAVRRRLPPLAMLGVLAAASFATAWWGVLHQPAGAFYLLPTRGWELALGAALGLGAAKGTGEIVRSWLRDLSSLAGLLLVAAAVATFDDHTPFPGPAALLPCVGTALLLWAGEGALVNRVLLSARPLVFVGLVSYSLYLWHWPILAFLRIQHDGELPAAPAAWAVAVACGLAYASWRFVEQPFRRASARRPGSVLLRYAAVVIVVALTGGIAWAGKGFPSRVPAEVARADAARADWGPLHWAGCHGSPSRLPNPRCVTGPDGERQMVTLWGDSHADAISPAIQAWAERQGMGFVQITRSGCPPLAGARVLVNRIESSSCMTFLAQALEFVTHDPRIGVVVLASRWPLLTETVANEGGPTVHLLEDRSGELGKEGSRRAFEIALRRVSAAILASGKELVVIGPIPEMGRHVPDCLVRRAMPLGAFSDCGASAVEVLERERFATSAIERLAREVPSIRTFFPAEVLCRGGRCRSVLDGAVLYLDDDHLTSAGARLLAGPLGAAISEQRAR